MVTAKPLPDDFETETTNHKGVVELDTKAGFGHRLIVDEDGDVWFYDGDGLCDAGGPNFLTPYELRRIADRAEQAADD